MYQHLQKLTFWLLKLNFCQRILQVTTKWNVIPLYECPYQHYSINKLNEEYGIDKENIQRAMFKFITPAPVPYAVLEMARRQTGFQQNVWDWSDAQNSLADEHKELFKEYADLWGLILGDTAFDSFESGFKHVAGLAFDTFMTN